MMSGATHLPPTPSLLVRLRYRSLCSACTDALSNEFHRNDDEASKYQTWSVEALSQSVTSCRCCLFLLRVLEASPWLAPRNDSNVHLTTALVGSQHSSPYERQQDRVSPWLSKDERLAQFTEYKRYYRLQFTAGNQSTFILPTAITGSFDTETVDAENAFCGRPVGPAVNFPLVQSWLKLCTTTHQGPSEGDALHPCYKGKEEHSTSGRGCSPLPSDPIPNFRLVDVKTRCVVCINHKTEYAALSYVWGDCKRFFLSKDNIDLLSLPGALDYESVELPRTFKDAVEVAEKLSMRYIWIDSLCILQDSPDQLVEHMNSMDIIYSAAALTIVSDAASADAGIPGLSTLRMPPQATFQHNGTQYISAKKTFGHALEDSPWERRAWCLQEKVFSNRLLVFTETQAFYHCAAATWFEDTQLESKPNISGPVHIREKPSYSRKDEWVYRRPHQTAYEAHRDYFGRNFWQLIENYTRRTLSFESDAIRAFSGILRSLEPQNGVAVWGTPQREFGRGISFKHSDHRLDLRREGFPSWSWAGWRTSYEANLKFVNVKRKDSDIEVSEGRYRIERGPNTNAHSVFDIAWHYHVPDSATGESRPTTIQTTFEEPVTGTVEQVSSEAATIDGIAPSSPQSSGPNRIPLWGISGHPGEEDYTHTTSLVPLQHQLGMPPISHVLQFYTSAAPVIVGPPTTTDQRGGDSQRSLHIPGSTEALQITVDLDPAYDAQGKETMLVFVSRWCRSEHISRKGIYRQGYLNLLLVESVEGWGLVKRRVQLIDHVRIDSWRAANPQWQLMSLA
ncbi:HET-domain-containing protein [Plenodomus tracheiphilus IPT5]|uniref:HET-domain-containing protein n=1 Tax=Plenodomus tracheiphilus IPT5 TaxID=1408161 RepID=A0A6A7BDI5_9PLEO|nr:HET-domain-containing protein [Plenodomus tracheiphilus IPT5]